MTSFFLSILAKTVFDEPTMDVARKWHWRKFGVLQWLWPIAGVALVICGALWTQGQLHRVTGPAFIGFGVWCITRKWLLGIQSRRPVQKSPQYRKTYCWTFNEQELQGEGEQSSFKTGWGQFAETVSTPDGFLLYPVKNIYYWIPRSGFSSDHDYEAAKRIIATSPKHQELT